MITWIFMMTEFDLDVHLTSVQCTRGILYNALIHTFQKDVQTIITKRFFKITGMK